MTQTAGPIKRSYFGGPWWILLLRGILLVILGIYMLALPADNVLEFTQTLAVYLILDGILMLAAVLMGQPNQLRRWLILAGGGGIAIGLFILGLPLVGVAISALVIVIFQALLAVRAILSGISDLALAILHWQTLKHSWLMVWVGLLSIGFGLFLIIFPVFGFNISVVQVLGVFLIVFGCGLTTQAFRLRNDYL
ncbi:HdeD family acid-resistance protein [Chloroflexota bacterium]